MHSFNTSQRNFLIVQNIFKSIIVRVRKHPSRLSELIKISENGPIPLGTDFQPENYEKIPVTTEEEWVFICSVE